MRIPLLSDRRCDMLAALVCVVVALSCASFMPTIVGQKVVDLSVAYSLPQGFFILNVKDNGILGANHSWSLSGGIPINKALVNTEYYLFNLTYNRTTSGGITPPNFDASQTFEINLLGTIGGADGGLKEWNVYGYGDQVDLWTVRTNTAEPNALFSFDLVDQANKVYIIRYNLDRNQCVTTTRGGLDFVLAPYSVNNASQQFQLIDAFNPNPPSPVAGGELLDVGAGYSLANGFFISNVLDNAILGANHSWSLTGGIPYAKAVVNSEYYLFNLTFNRTSTGGNAPPNFDSSKYFEVNLLSTLTLPDGFKQWNVYGWKDQVDLYTVRGNTAEQNALFAFDLVDQANKVYVIRTRLNAANCVSTIGGGVDFVVKPCQAGNNAFRFQLINPFPGSGDTSSSSDSNFFSTAGGVIVILIIIAVCLGGAYAGWRFYQKWSHTTKHHKSGTSEPALLASLTTNGAEQDHEEAQGSYRKIGDNMELGNVQENNGHTSNSARASTRGTSPNDDY